MRDFTLQTYRELLLTLQKADYQFLTFEEYISSSVRTERWVILRHDVDLKAANSLRTAEIEYELGIRTSYYFRIIKESNQPDIIKAIAALGHEIGYHYEDLSLAHGDMNKAITSFREHLAYFRQYYPVKTICMHGAPTSQYDGRDLWKKYNYRDEGLTGEPYFDMDFTDAFYLTDTGRCWDGYKVSVRDKVPQQDQWVKQGLVFHTTQDVMQAIAGGQIAQLHHLMITTHPQRWTDRLSVWGKEWLMQTVKNMVKRLLILCHVR